MRRPVFWIVLTLAAAAAVAAGVRYFPQAFSIVALDMILDPNPTFNLAASKLAMTPDTGTAESQNKTRRTTAEPTLATEFLNRRSMCRSQRDSPNYETLDLTNKYL